MRTTALALCMLLVAASGQAQVTITTEDLQYEIGGYYSMYNVASPHGVIGLTGIQGGPHVFDFSAGITAVQWTFNYVDVTDGGHNADFPAATIAERKDSDSGSSWLYLDFQSGVGRTNYGFYDEVGTPESPSVPFNPEIVDFADNLSYQSFFMGSTSFNVTSAGVELEVDYAFTGFCDAYGTVILPDGLGEHECIQVNYEEEYVFKWMDVPVQYSYIRSYYYLADELGIVAIIISREEANPVPNDFNIAAAIARMYETSKQDPNNAVSEFPAVIQLGGNYPNPFNPHTNISFVLAEKQDVLLRVFDVGGRLVDTLVHGAMPAGSHEVTWTGADLNGRETSPGVYYYRLDAGSFSQTRPMTLLR